MNVDSNLNKWTIRGFPTSNRKSAALANATLEMSFRKFKKFSKRCE